ncbi:MAG: zinc-binding dehydrogenase [Clostridia bacterium]|nr:zinc-binding dehydrogenase [Clostridia bacterium]
MSGTWGTWREPGAGGAAAEEGAGRGWIAPVPLPERMLAAVAPEPGGPEVLRLEEIPLPAAEPGHVLIRVRTVTVNRGLDLEARQFGRVWGVAFPHVGGVDAAGEVVAVAPGVAGWEPGERVAVLPWLTCGRCPACRRGNPPACERFAIWGVHTDGADAEYASVPASLLIRLPDGVDFAEASAAMVSYSVAWHLVVTLGRVRPTETVLVLAAGSGIGVAAMQIARLHGARVLAAAGARWKLERAMELGAEAGIPYRELPFDEEARRLTGGHGVDLVVENLGAETWERSVRSLATGGRLVTAGVTTGAEVQLNVRYAYRNHLTFYCAEASLREEAEAVLDLIARGQLRPVVHRRYPLARIAEAQQELLGREVFGKLVIEV